MDGVHALVGARVVIECMSSMKRHGVKEEELGQLHAAIEDVRLEGFALHLPLDRTDGSDAVEEVIGWMDRLRAARLPLHTMFVSHLRAEELARLQQQFPQTLFRARIGTRLWLGDHEATEYRGAVLDVTPVVKGDRFGYRQQKAASDGWLVVVAGGTSHGVGLEAPKALHGVMPRAKGVARAGLATVNRNLSPFVWGGQAALVRRAAAHAGVDPVRAVRRAGTAGRGRARRPPAPHHHAVRPARRPLSARANPQQGRTRRLPDPRSARSPGGSGRTARLPHSPQCTGGPEAGRGLTSRAAGPRTNASGAPSSTPPDGSSRPSARTGSLSGIENVAHHQRAQVQRSQQVQADAPW
ncbi:hypothetical protein SCALM49S_06459 [Streptomyces californicus]